MIGRYLEGVFLRHNNPYNNHITRCFIVILAKKMSKFYANGGNYGPRGCPFVRPMFLNNYDLTAHHVYFLWQNFCCQIQQYPIKAWIDEIRSKMGRKSQKYPNQKSFFFYKMFQFINMSIDKSFAQISIIKNFKIYRVLLALKVRKSPGREN